jgi:D-hexose-6-phosphate mutarotase
MRTLCGIILAAALPFEVLAQGTPGGSSEKERIGRVCDGEFGSFNARFMGAQTWSWKPAKTEGDEILFMPKNAPWGKEVHGGIPICWPWFGAPPKDGLPKHGLARYVTWRFKERDWKTGVLFELDSNDETRRIWPHDFHLEVQLKMKGDDSLLVRLTETNTGKEPFESAWGFHPYFRVTDAERVAVDGEVQPTPSVRVQSSATEKGHRRTLTDLVSGRMISVECTDNEDWFVWNPGVDRTPLCETLGPDEWKRFYCGNVAKSGMRVEENGRSSG